MRKLAIDVTSGVLVDYQGSPSALEPFRQGRETVQVRLVQPTTVSAFVNASYEPADISAYLGLRLGIWSNSTGTLDDSATYVLALTPHDQFTYNTADADDPYFTGTLDTYTSELAAFLGSEKSKDAYFAVGLVNADLTINPIYDHRGTVNCTCLSATDDASGTLPTSAVPGTRFITLPVFFTKTVAGVTQRYVLDENADRSAVLITPYTP